MKATLGESQRRPAVKAEVRSHKGGHWDFTKQPGRWREQFWSSKGELVVEVFISRADGKVQEEWTGFQAAWTMARGYPGAFGKDASALWVWLPLLALFLLPFLPRQTTLSGSLRQSPPSRCSQSRLLVSTGDGWTSRFPLFNPPLLWLLMFECCGGASRGPSRTQPRF